MSDLADSMHTSGHGSITAPAHTASKNVDEPGKHCMHHYSGKEARPCPLVCCISSSPAPLHSESEEQVMTKITRWPMQSCATAGMLHSTDRPPGTESPLKVLLQIFHYAGQAPVQYQICVSCAALSAHSLVLTNDALDWDMDKLDINE